MMYPLGLINAGHGHYGLMVEPFGAEWGPARAALEAVGSSCPFRRNEPLMVAGGPSNDVFLVGLGLVKVVIPTPEGVDVVTGLYGAGELFGEIGVLDRRPRSATVLGHQAGVATRVPAATFRQLVHDDAEVRRFVDATQRRRLRIADRRQQALASMNVRARVIAQLIEWAAVCGDAGQEGLILKGLSHRDLAGAVLASEKHVDAVLRELRSAGWLRTRRMCIIVPDPARLAQSVGGLDWWLKQ